MIKTNNRQAILAAVGPEKQQHVYSVSDTFALLLTQAKERRKRERESCTCWLAGECIVHLVQKTRKKKRWDGEEIRKCSWGRRRKHTHTHTHTHGDQRGDTRSKGNFNPTNTVDSFFLLHPAPRE
jgi:hypothetical protein